MQGKSRLQRVKATEAMRVRGSYSNCEAADSTLQMQVHCAIKKIKGEVTSGPPWIHDGPSINGSKPSWAGLQSSVGSGFDSRRSSSSLGLRWTITTKTMWVRTMTKMTTTGKRMTCPGKSTSSCPLWDHWPSAKVGVATVCSLCPCRRRNSNPILYPCPH